MSTPGTSGSQAAAAQGGAGASQEDDVAVGDKRKQQQNSKLKYVVWKELYVTEILSCLHILVMLNVICRARSVTPNHYSAYSCQLLLLELLNGDISFLKLQQRLMKLQ